MWPYFKNGFKKFFTDEQAFATSFEKQVGRIRGALVSAGAAIALYGNEIAASLPQWATKIKVGGLLIMGLGAAIKAGDRTPQNVKDLAATLPPSQP